MKQSCDPGGPNPGGPNPGGASFGGPNLDALLAKRLKALRQQRGWSLEALGQASGVSRATLSRLENAEVSATAAVLTRICAAYGLPVSRLVAEAEAAGERALVRRNAQPVWTDPDSGYLRRSVSPPADSLAGEAIEGRLPPGARILYDHPPPARSALTLEHHLVLLEGGLTVELWYRPPSLPVPAPAPEEPASSGGDPGFDPGPGRVGQRRPDLGAPAASYRLAPGDCLRFRAIAASAYTADGLAGARYLLFLV